MNEAIRQYLKSEFGVEPEFSTTPSGSLKARVETGECAYGAQFDRDLLEEHPEGQIAPLLHEWNIAAEMRRMEGMDISVSSAGVRLESSN